MRCSVLALGLLILSAPALALAQGVNPGGSRGVNQGVALLGEPFGVGRLTAAVDDPDAGAQLALNALVLEERQGRALYPAFVTRPLEPGRGPVTIEAWFLFTGREPLELTLYTPRPIKARLTPLASRPEDSDRLLAQWWAEYRESATRQQAEGDYPPLPQAYLTSMLARRLRLESPALFSARAPGVFQETFELLLGLENARLQSLVRTNLSERLRPAPATLPVPPGPEWPALAPPSDDQVQVEPMAMHVPEEWFYVRFGTFANYLWFRELLEENGGELGRLVTLRGFNPNLGQRMERQLALKQSALAEIVGGQVIRDVAFVGRDTYLREGAAIGIQFQTHPERGPLLANDIRTQHNAALRREAERGATLQQVEIAGREVSLLSTPDNRLRAFHAIDGDFQLVTTSAAMVERFFASGQGERPLGASPEFRHARTVLPVTRADTVFVYLSSRFFQGLLSPQYQIELARRLDAVTDIDLVLLARLAARGEGQPNQTLEELIAGGFLPQGFGLRADGSGPVLESQRVLDARRGARGSFLPIPDVQLSAVTDEEQQTYLRRASFYQQQWPQLDPIMVGIKRYALNDDRLERIVVDARISPFQEEKYGWLTGMLGEPIRERLTMPSGSIATAQVSLRGGLLLPHVPPHILFGGIQDMVPATDLKPQGLLETFRLLRSTPGYVGAWPKPGFLDMLPLGLGGGPPDALGYSRLLLGLWRRQWERYSVLSFDYRVLSDVTPQLRVEQADSDAQLILNVGDLSQSEFSTWVAATNYARAWQTTVGNLRFLHGMSQQFRISRQDTLAAIEDLIDAQLVCSLGGQYRLVEPSEGLPYWTSTALSTDGAERVPEDYEAPLLTWFRGLTAEVSKSEERLAVHAELDMQRSERQAKVSLPLFNLLPDFSTRKPAGKPADEPLKSRPAAPSGEPREF